VVLAAGFAAAIQAARLAHTNGEAQRVQRMRDRLLAELIELDQVQLTGVDPAQSHRLPHHISLLVSDRHGRCIPGRKLVRADGALGLPPAVDRPAALRAPTGGPVLF
jgi:cysteine desulfurase